MQKKSAIIIFTKIPRPGFVKTRLYKILTPNNTAILYGCFLKDILMTCLKNKHIEIFFSFYSPERKLFPRSNSKKFRVILQKGASLGERIEYSIRKVFRHGARSILLLCGDSPDIPEKILRVALGFLNKPGLRIAVGPAQDGGCYAIGFNNPSIISVCRQIKWKEKNTASTLIRLIKKNQYNLKILDKWYDIDTVKDLQFFLANLMKDKNRLHSTFTGRFFHKWLQKS